MSEEVESVEVETPVDAPVQESAEVEAESEIEVVDEIAHTEEPVEEEAPVQNENRGYVEFDTPEQQEKFNDVYKQMKMSDQRNGMLTNLLEEQQRQLETLQSRFDQSDNAAAENVLLDRIRTAKEEGDDEAEIEAISELTKFRASQMIPQQPVHQQVDPTYSSQELHDAQYVEGLMNATDLSGQPVRPWLNPSHPQYNQVLGRAAEISQKYDGYPDVVQRTFQEIDMEMSQNNNSKPVKNTRAPDPMAGSNLTNRKPKGKIKMTAQELEICQKLGVDPKQYAAERG